MPRENLNCSVTNCKYNNDLACKAGFIHISGACADKENETCCSSYVDKEGMSSSCSFNSSDFLSTTEPNDIKCDAVNCVYNDNTYCSASNVHIDAPNVCCDTFEKA